jgi:hypothetical protein
VLFAGQDLPPYKYKGSWPIERDHPIEHINFTFLSPTLLFQPLCFLLRLYDDLGRSNWPADLRTTLGALSLTGSLLGHDLRFSAKFMSKAVRPAPRAVRPARARNLDEVIIDYRAIQRTRVFDWIKRQHTFGDVTTPSEIILYYHLNHSIWSLSDNKESSR